MPQFDDSALYAHSPGPDGRWHLLGDHLGKVANKASDFAGHFGISNAAQCAYWIGLLHDLGKAIPEFQSYLRAVAAGRPHLPVPHAIWGAAFIYAMVREGGQQAEMWKELALPIFGHHAGLHDAGTAAQVLQRFLNDNRNRLPQLAAYLESHPTLPRFELLSRPTHRRELFIRMIFSALIDADRLDTEAHFHPERHQAPVMWPSIAALWQAFSTKQDEFLRTVEPTPVNVVRREVYKACLKAAEGPPGVYRLTVPTGGGKTRSGLAFALVHAVKYDLRRIIVAIPYTSIIDQTAQEYRKILGEDALLEHHSQVESKDETEAQDSETVRRRLATENWSANLIVTTTVQLFESLFANRPTRVRRLHNLARSVIVLDEVQTIPIELLTPTLDVLRALVEDYGVTLVLSTATQPVFEESIYITAFQGLQVQEIVPSYPDHFRRLKRVAYERLDNPLSWADLARVVRNRARIMVVLNSRRDAIHVVRLLQDVEDVFHLSTLLCGAHRRKILAEAKSRLEIKNGAAVRLVSTQVVEAGVDIDFPEVWRAIGPLDRVIQAAGRCNREGSRETGSVVLFEPSEGKSPGGPYKAGIEAARALLQSHGTDVLADPALLREYFRQLFASVDLDKKRIQQWRELLDYPKVADLYKLIQDETVPVVVDHEDGFARLEAWRKNPFQPSWLRLQPYVVNLFAWDARRLAGDGLLIEESPGLFRWEGRYDERLGLVESVYDPSDLIWCNPS